MIPPFKLVLEGQTVLFNKNSKVVILELENIFNRAGIIFDWKHELGVRAFGVNYSILKFVEMSKSKLLINYKSVESKTEYWINYDVMRNFVNNNNCEFRTSGKIIYNIPLSLFRSKPIFSGIVI